MPLHSHGNRSALQAGSWRDLCRRNLRKRPGSARAVYLSVKGARPKTAARARLQGGVHSCSIAEVKIETIAGIREGTRILCLSGPFTLEGVFAFQSIADRLNDAVVIIDLTDVPYMDSCALGAIMGLHRPSQFHQRQYVVVGASERLRTMFHVARVDDILVTYSTLEEAQQKLGFKAAGD